jgi:glycosyltransferase involved in cell wall biosynthesis
MALLEAMSVGLPPVITTETGISRELHERGSAIVTDGSVTALADAVIRLTSSPDVWEAASRAACADVRDSFSCEAVAVALQAVYEDAVAHPPQRSNRLKRVRQVP